MTAVSHEPSNLTRAPVDSKTLDARAIHAFLQAKRVALVGVSHEEKDFTRSLWTELRSRGVDVVPVNPKLDVLEGVEAFKDISAVTPPVDAVYVATPASASLGVMKAAVAAQVPVVWLHKGGGPGALDDAAVAWGRTHGAHVVAGQCLHMFLDHPNWVHRFHRGIKRILGDLPS